MWKREVKKTDLNNLLGSSCFLKFLWKSDDAPIYIMDNHLAAAWCWMQECNTDENYNFMHIDQHSDLGVSGYAKDIAFMKKNPRLSLDDYNNISYTTINGKFQFFKWDNYIRSCHYLFPNWFETSLFYYTKSHLDGEVSDRGYDLFPKQRMDSLFVREDITLFIKEQRSNLNKTFLADNMRTKKWIVNIDLDFFWDNNNIKVFDNQFIIDLGKRLSDAMKNIQVLTIALSPKCCGGWDNALECSKLFLSNPVLIELCKEYLEEDNLFPNDWR